VFLAEERLPRGIQKVETSQTAGESMALPDASARIRSLRSRRSPSVAVRGWTSRLWPLRARVETERTRRAGVG
jgi:hypothetical protein